MLSIPFLGNDLLWQLGEGVRTCSHRAVPTYHLHNPTYIPSCYSSHLALLLLHCYTITFDTSLSDSPRFSCSLPVFLPGYLLFQSISISPVPLGDSPQLARCSTSRRQQSIGGSAKGGAQQQGPDVGEQTKKYSSLQQDHL